MKKLFVSIVATLTLCSCNTPSLKINGNITNIANGKVYIATFDSLFMPQVVDTVAVENGKFVANVALEEPECVMILLDNPNEQRQPRLISVFAGKENVTIEGDAQKPDDIQTTGSEYNDILMKFQKNVPEMERLQQLANEMRTIGNDIDRRNELMDEIRNIQLEQLAYYRKVISENEQNPIGAFLLRNSLQNFNFEEVDSLTSIFERSLPKHKYIRALRQIIENARPEHDAQAKVKVGCVAPDFTLPSIDGKEVTLSSFRGHVVLIDFWASWCQPCRKNNESLIDTYNKFAPKGLEVISISVDNNSEAWRKAVKDDALKGVLLIDSANIVAATYCVRTIPHGILIDQDGIIVSTDTPMENLFKDIEKMLK